MAAWVINGPHPQMDRCSFYPDRRHRSVAPNRRFSRREQPQEKWFAIQ